MRDTIILEGLEARGVIGVEDWERKQPQTIRIDVEMACDADRPAASDDIAETINYRAVAKAILAHIDENAYHLVETLAVRLANMIREEHGVPWVRVRVTKPGAIRFSQNVGIVVERGARGA